MKHFVLPDQYGFVYNHVIGPEAPGEAWVEVAFDASVAATSPTRHRLVNGALVDSGKPKIAPARHLRWTGEDWTDPRTPEQATAEAWADVRTQRNKLLAASDWTDTYSAPARLGQTLYGRWQTYRQALRDITQQPDPLNITWPQAPN